MIIGCLGKGGSGKSTVATLLTKKLMSEKNQVLAIDADHNMDLSHNLEVPLEKMNFLGSSLPTLLSKIGLSEGEKYYEIFFKKDIKEPQFSFFTNPDDFSSEYAYQLSENLRVMAAGPHTDNILHGKLCSHSLGTPLKVYLPFLSLQENDYVVIDEKAGSDGAGTGVCTGFDVACVMTEPTEHGVKAANQIADLLEYFGTPYVFVGNKIMDEEDKAFVASHLKQAPVIYIDHGKATRNAELTPEISEKLDELIDSLSKINMNDRIKRSREKFEKNKEYSENIV